MVGLTNAEPSSLPDDNMRSSATKARATQTASARDTNTHDNISHTGSAELPHNCKQGSYRFSVAKVPDFSSHGMTISLTLPKQ